MITASLVGHVADGSSEFAFHDDQCFIQPRAAAVTGHTGKVGDEIAKAEIQLPGGPIDSGVGLIDVTVVVPTAEVDLKVSCSHIRADEVSDDDTRTAESGIAVPLLVGCRKAEYVVHVRIIHQALGARIKITHLVKVNSKRICLIERLQYLVPFVERRLSIGMLQVRKAACICRHIEGSVARREVAIALYTISSSVQRHETRQNLSGPSSWIILHRNNGPNIRSDARTRTGRVPRNLIPCLQQ